MSRLLPEESNPSEESLFPCSVLVFFRFLSLSFGRAFGDHAHSAWVGIAGDPPEVFLALIVHDEHSSRMLVRWAQHDRLMEFVTTSSDSRLLRHLNPTELHQVHALESLRELDSIGVQNVQLQKEFKFGVIYCDGTWNERELFENNNVSKEFDEFLEMMGTRVKLQGFSRYAGGLDTGPGGAATSGEHGLFAEYGNAEVGKIWFACFVFLSEAGRKKGDVSREQLDSFATRRRLSEWGGTAEAAFGKRLLCFGFFVVHGETKGKALIVFFVTRFKSRRRFRHLWFGRVSHACLWWWLPILARRKQPAELAIAWPSCNEQACRRLVCHTRFVVCCLVLVDLLVKGRAWFVLRCTKRAPRNKSEKEIVRVLFSDFFFARFRDFLLAKCINGEKVRYFPV